MSGDDITAAWLSSVTGWHVDTVDVTEIGVGLGVSSAVFRAELTTADGPPSVIVKLTASDPAAVFTCTVLKMYRREVEFFRQLAALAPVRVPDCHHAHVNDDGSQIAVVMEDLGGNRSGDQLTGLSIADAERAVDALAAWHLRWWRKVDGLCDSGAAVALGDPIYPAMLPGLFEEGWAKLLATPACLPPVALTDIGLRFAGALPRLLQRLNDAPNTLAHGDFRADNLMFDADGALMVIDFQLTGTGSGAYDLAYLITQSLTDEVAAEHEQLLFARWHAGLIAGGVPAEDLSGMWDDYRTAALFCLVYPVVAVRGMDLSDPQLANLANTMLRRMARASEHLHLDELL